MAAVGPLVVIVGQTASGKSDLALKLAEKYDGEIICADSRTVYKGMDIGTAKPTKQDQSRVPHHLLDVIDPEQPFTVSAFKDLADQAIDDILKRGKVPFLVGGSGLYIDAVIYNYNFAGSDGPRDAQNPRHLSADAPKRPLELRANTLILGMNIEPEELKQRIGKRVDVMVEGGLVDEVKQLGERYGWDIPPMQAPAYKSFRSYVEGAQSLEQAKAQFAVYDSQLARKQRTWFKRNKSIQWLDDPREADVLVAKFLNKTR